MTIMDKVDIVRHLFELIFYVITGPLVTIFAIKKFKQARSRKYQILNLQRKLLEMSQKDNVAFKNAILPLIEKLDSGAKSDSAKEV